MQKLTFKNSIGEVDIGQSRPYLLQTVDGISGLGVTEETQKAPYQDGDTFLSNNFITRDIVINGMIMLDTCEIEDTKEELARIFNPKLPATLVYTNGTITKECSVNLRRSIRYAQANDRKGVNYQAFQLLMTAHNPFWLDIDYSSKILALSVPAFEFPLIAEPTFEFETEGTNRATITNNGDVVTPVEIVFTGPANKPKILNETTEEYIEVNKNLNIGETLTITTDFGNKKVIFNDGTNDVNAFGLIELDSVFWQLQRGENVISYSAATGISTANMRISWKERFTSI